MATEADLLGAFEVNSPEGIMCALDAGISAVGLIQGKRPIDCLIESYLRSPRFADCIRTMLSAGADPGDPLLEALLFGRCPEFERPNQRRPDTRYAKSQHI
jgi:hypothetical protein